MTNYKKSLKPGRDQTKTKRALDDFKIVITKYPLSEEAKNARGKIKECEEKLAAHEIAIAIHYYRVRAFKASISRLTDILTAFPDFSKMDKVYYYLADSYFKLEQVEQIVNEQIQKALLVKMEEMTVEQAKEKGAIGLFEEKYGDKVKVYSINDFSCEICGGPHVKNIKELSEFKIKKEESSSSGVRRIKAVLV